VEGGRGFGGHPGGSRQLCAVSVVQFKNVNRKIENSEQDLRLGNPFLQFYTGQIIT